MGFWSGARKTFLPFASAKEWFNFSQVKESTDTLLMLVRRYLVPNSNCLRLSKLLLRRFVLVTSSMRQDLCVCGVIFYV